MTEVNVEYLDKEIAGVEQQSAQFRDLFNKAEGALVALRAARARALEPVAVAPASTPAPARQPKKGKANGV